MKQDKVELININDARNPLSSGGLEHLVNLIYKNKTVNVGSRTFITKRQFENCLKKEAEKSTKYSFINHEIITS